MTAAVFVLTVSLSAQSAAVAPSAAADASAQAYFLFLQARTLEDAGKIDDAIASFKQAIALTPKASGPHAELAALYARAGRANESVDEADAALKLDPDDRDAHRILGLVQAAVAERATSPASASTLMTEAIAHLAQSVNGGRRDPAAELTLGRLYVETGNTQKGIETLQLFLLGTPGYPEALTLLGQAYENAGQYAQAIDTVQPLLEGSGGDTDTRTWLAGLYEKAGRWKEAAAAWGDLATRAPTEPTYPVRQAAALVNAGDVDAGRKQLADITTKAPQDIPAWYMLSLVERRAGHAAEAEAAARHILAINAQDPRGVLALAGAQSSRGDFTGAAATLAPHVTSPTPAEIQSGTFSQMAGDLAANYERAKQIDLAEQTYRHAIGVDPEDADALNGLGYLLADHGRQLDEAVSLVTRALAVDHDNPSYLDSLGWAYFKQARLDLAQPPLERAAGAVPQSSVIQAHLGELYFQLKRYRDAAAAWDRALAGDRADIDVDAVTRQRDRARALAGRE